MSSYCWITLHDQFTLTKDEISELCDAHLLYMGPGKFAEIKRIQPPVPCTPNSLPSTLSMNPPVTPNKRDMANKRRKGRNDPVMSNVKSKCKTS